MNAIPQWINALNQPPSWAPAVLQSAAAAPEQRLQACQILIQSGAVRWTKPFVDALTRLPETAARAEQLAAMCGRLWEYDLIGGPPAPARVVPDGATTGDFWVVPAASRKTIVVFTGQAKRLSVSVYMLQRMLEPYAVNVVYLFDKADLFYLAGVGESWRGVAGTTDLLRRLCDAMGSETVYCMGQSTGGYGALRYGAALGARGALAFSPKILSPLRDKNRARLSAALGRAATTAEIDLRGLYQATATPPRTIVVCGADNRADMRSAAELSDLPGVDHRPLPGVADHGVVANLLQSGGFQPLLTELLESP